MNLAGTGKSISTMRVIFARPTCQLSIALTPPPLSPTELLQRDVGIPYLGQMVDPVGFEVHDVHVVRADSFTGRRHRASWTGMCSGEHSIGDHIVSRRIC